MSQRVGNGQFLAVSWKLGRASKTLFAEKLKRKQV